jgi:hypothetical protein
MTVQQEKRANLSTRRALFLSKLTHSRVQMQHTSHPQGCEDQTDVDGIVIFSRMGACRKNEWHGGVSRGCKYGAAWTDFNAFTHLEAIGAHEEVEQVESRLDSLSRCYGDDVVPSLDAKAVRCFCSVINQPVRGWCAFGHVRRETDNQIFTWPDGFHERRTFREKLQLLVQKIARLAIGQLAQRQQLQKIRKGVSSEQFGCSRSVHGEFDRELACAVQPMGREAQGIQGGSQPQGEAFLQLGKGCRAVQVSFFQVFGSMHFCRCIRQLMHIASGHHADFAMQISNRAPTPLSTLTGTSFAESHLLRDNNRAIHLT